MSDTQMDHERRISNMEGWKDEFAKGFDEFKADMLDVAKSYRRLLAVATAVIIIAQFIFSNMGIKIVKAIFN